MTHKDGKLTVAFNGLTYELEHWHYDTFRGADVRGVLPRMLFTFVLGPDGTVVELRQAGVSGDDLKLKRKTD